MPDKPTPRPHLEAVPPDPLSSTAPPAGWQDQVTELLDRVAAQRGMDYESAPAAVTAALPQLVDHVENLATTMGSHDRRWLAAALAALADQVERTTLPEQPS
jgi:hypothetical protein